MSTPDPAYDDDDRLRREFRAIAMVLPLVTAMNNHGYSNLEPSHGEGTRHLHDILDKGLRNQLLALNAISTLLVRDAEVVAVTNSVSPGNTSIGVVSLDNDDRQEGQVSPDNFTQEQIDALQVTMNNGFTTFTNASPKDTYFKSNESTKVRMVPPGESYWARIIELRKPFAIITGLPIKRNDPLENHIATITDFVNTYRLEKDDAARGTYFWNIGAYLVMTCWRKMYRRIKNWTSMGFIHCLQAISLDQLRIACKKHVATRSLPLRRDKSLYDDISGISDEDGQTLMSNLSEAPQTDSIYRLKTALAVANNENVTGYDPDAPAYNESTCVEFHQFLLALLLGYGRALKRCHRAYKAEGWALHEDQRLGRKMLRKNKAKAAGAAGTQEKRKELSELQKATCLLFIYAQLLWRVTSSCMFDDHVKVLQGTSLALPSELQTRVYQRYADFEDGEIDHEDGAVGRDGNVNCEVREKGEDDEVSEKEDVEEELRRRINLADTGTPQVVTDKSPAYLFKNWARLNTSYFTALQILIKGAKNSSQEFTTELIAANHRDGHKVTAMNWNETIRRLCSREGRDAESQATTTPSDHPNTNANDPNHPRPQLPSSRDSVSTLRYFSQMDADDSIRIIQAFINNESPEKMTLLTAFGAAQESGEPYPHRPTTIGHVAWIGNLHCEAVAAALAKYSHLAVKTNDPQLLGLISKFDKSSLAVSKLCCPICWELLQVLRGENQDVFQVRGYHTSLYPVELPSWLPKEDLEQMVKRFQGHLRRELIVLLRNQPKKTHKSSESHSSVASNSSDASVSIVDVSDFPRLREL